MRTTAKERRMRALSKELKRTTRAMNRRLGAMDKPETNDIFNGAPPWLAPGSGESCDVTADKLLDYLALRATYQICVLSQALGWFPVERETVVGRLEYVRDDEIERLGECRELFNVERWTIIEAGEPAGMRLMIKGADR